MAGRAAAELAQLTVARSALLAARLTAGLLGATRLTAARPAALAPVAQQASQRLSD